MCPEDHRCNIDNLTNEFCASYIPDADRNFDFKQADGRGWSGGCVEFDDLKEGMEISTSNYKNTNMRVEKI